MTRWCWPDRLIPGGLALGSGVAYLATLSPGVRVETDVGELQFVGYVLGTAHPTGYPLHTMLSWAFTHAVPLGTVAWRANLLTAVSASAAVAVLYIALRALGLGRVVSAGGAVAFAALPSWWRYSVMAEVYSLHVLLMGVGFAGLITWLRGGERRALWAAIAAGGLALGHHMLIGLCLPGAAWLVWRSRWRNLLAMKDGLWLAGWVGAGVGQYGYLAWRFADEEARFVTRTSADLGTLLEYVTGSVFHGYLQWPAAGPWQRVHDVVADCGLQTAAAVTLGLAAPVLVRDRTVGVALGLTAALHVGTAVVYGIADIAPYLFPAAWIGAVAGASGLHRVTASGRSWGWAGLAVALCLPTWMVASNADAAELGQARSELRWVERVTGAAGRDAVFVVDRWEQAVALWAHHHTEGGRERGLWVHADKPTPEGVDRVLGYARGEHVLKVPEQREDIPPRLEVYCIGLAWARALRARGVELTPATPGVFRVHVSDGSPSLRSR